MDSSTAQDAAALSLTNDWESLLKASADGGGESDGQEQTQLRFPEHQEALPQNIALDDDESDPLPNAYNDHTIQWRNPTARCRQLYAQLSWAELSGSLGDLGTFLPLLVALGRARAIYVGPALIYAGLANLLTGYLWDLPMPVQPMKSISATALYAGWKAPAVTASGVWMGMFLTVLGASPTAMDRLAACVPRAVVSGMQVGVGLSLALHGLEWMSQLEAMWWHVPTMDSLCLGLTVGAVSLFALRPSSLSTAAAPPPVALYVFGLASLLAILRLVYGTRPDEPDDDDQTTPPVLGFWALGRVTGSDWSTGLWEGALPQLPLTLLNSVISVCALADTLFPDKPRDALTKRQVAWSVGWMNLVLCPLGAMPNCHGAGGLAGQYKFGARGGASIMVLGMAKILAAVLMGPQRLILFLDALPRSLLAVLILMAGHTLAVTGIVRLGASQSETDAVTSNVDDAQRILRSDLGVCLWTAAVIVGLRKTHYGALTGCIAYVLTNPKVTSRQSAWFRSWWSPPSLDTHP
jgi:hypothetical protein